MANWSHRDQDVDGTVSGRGRKVRMTIARKLWLGFGILILMFAVASVMIEVNLGTIQAGLERLSAPEDPIHQAAEAMDISLSEIQMSILKYLASEDPKYRDEVVHFTSDWDHSRTRFDELASTNQEKEFGNTINAFYGEYKILGDSLMNARDSEAALHVGIHNQFKRMYEIVREKVQARERNQISEELKSAESSGDRDAVIAKMNAWLEGRLEVLGTEHSERLFVEVEDFRQLLERYRSLKLTQEDKDWFTGIEKVFHGITLLTQQEHGIEIDLQRDMKKLMDLRSKIHHLLDSGVLSLTHQSLHTSAEAAHRAVREARIEILVMLLIALIVGSVAAFIISNSVVGSVHRLVASTKKIGAGMLEHRVHVKTRDEIGELGTAFNRMTEALSELGVKTEKLQAEKLESMGLLAAGASHEVKNLLAILQQGADYFSTKLKTDDTNAPVVLQEMNGAVHKADMVIKGLVAVANLSKPRMALEWAQLPSVMNQALHSIKYQCDQGKIEIINEMSQNLPAVQVDQNLIKQVFVNLFLNAIQAMPQGGQLRIRAYPKKLEEVGHKVGRRSQDVFRLGETAVVVDIEDTGHGIPEEMIHKVFDPFFTTKRAQGGTGLGLSVVRSIIEMHQGTVALENRPEGGVRASVMLRVG